MSFRTIKQSGTMLIITTFLSYLIVVVHCTPVNDGQNITDTETITQTVKTDNSTDNLTSGICDRPICKDWELVTNLTIEDTLPVYKFISKRTGMTIVLATAESPIVNGYFCLSTEAFNNDGLPHTLEHLVFLGR